VSTQAKETTDFGEQQPGINRLLGMVVQEVSLVDRAANKRKFLIMKRDPMATANVKKDDTAGAPAMPGGDNQPSAEKLPAMQAQVKDALLAALTAAGEKLVNLATAVREADVSDAQVDPPVAASVTGEIGEIASMLQGLASQYGGAATAGDGKAAAPPAGAPAAPAKASGLPGVSENGAQDEQGEQKRDAEAVAKALAVLKAHTQGKPMTLKAEDAATVLKALEPLEKAGRKMAKERLERFRKAMDLLAGILKELSLDRTRKSAGAPPTTVTLKADEARALLETSEQLVAELRKRDAELASIKTQLHAVKKAAQPSNSLPAEGAPAPAPVSWPLDMNRKIAPKSPSTNFGNNGR